MIATAILSNRVITPAGIERAAVLIDNGIIADVVPALPAGEFQVVDVGDNILMPGIIDSHVHINEPGRTDWEGFDSATRSAIAGGVTSLVDMPLNSSPVTTSVAAFQIKLDAASEKGTQKLNCDVGFWGGIVPGNEKEIEGLVRMGVLGFKAFLTHSGIDEFPNVVESDLRKAMPIIAAHHLPLLVHCEIDKGEQIHSNNPGSYQEYLQSRPDHWETDAIALMVRLCKEFHCHVHIVHLSSAQSIPLIARAKQQGLPLTVETAQHYLFFNAENIPDGRTEYKCAPPIRDLENNKLLWQALKAGLIDFVATDHSPAPPHMKQPASGDLSKAWGGISSIQLALSALWTRAGENDCTPEQMAEWLCTAPARLASLCANKGSIAKGMQADFVVWDPAAKFKVDAGMLHHRHKVTPYLGQELYGAVKQTWLKGIKVFDDGKFLHLNKGELLFNH